MSKFNNNISLDVGFEMTKLSKERTCLPYDIWIDDLGKDRKSFCNKPFILVEIDNELIPIAISKTNPNVLNNRYLVTKEMDLIKKFIINNYDILIKHWNKEVDNVKAILEIQKKANLNSIFSQKFNDLQSVLLVGQSEDTGNEMLRLVDKLVKTYQPEDLKIILISSLDVFSEFGQLDKSRFDTVALLNDLCSSLENRFKHFANLDVSNIEEYNTVNPENRLPYCIVFIHNLDELMLAYKGIRKPLFTLLQKSRAAGFRFIVSSDKEALDVLGNSILSCLTKRLDVFVDDNNGGKK